MKLAFDPNRPQTEADRAALALIGEGFRRLRAQQASALGVELLRLSAAAKDWSPVRKAPAF